MVLVHKDGHRNDEGPTWPRDWEALGRLVRRRTLEALAGHFAQNATATDSVTDSGNAIPVSPTRERRRQR